MNATTRTERDKMTHTMFAKLTTSTVRFQTKNEALIGIGIIRNRFETTPMSVERDVNSAWYTQTMHRLTWEVTVNADISDNDREEIQKEANWITKMMKGSIA
jgi:hypothetical protein